MSGKSGSFQSLVLKFQRRFFQVLLQAVLKPDVFILFVFGRFHVIRDFVIFISQQQFTQSYAQENTCFPELDVEQAVDSLRSDGIYLGLQLPDTLVQDILTFSRDITYYDSLNHQFSFTLAERESWELSLRKSLLLAYHPNPSLLCPTLKKLENDPKLWEIAAKYLETQPVITGTKLRWIFAGEKEAIPESGRGFFNFHYDLEDYRFIKFIFYLTDVEASSGAHVCVQGSHRKKKLRHQFSLTRERDDKSIIDYYGAEKIKTICAKAGFGFVEDLFCFHKVILPASTDRLILEITFARKKYEL